MSLAEELFADTVFDRMGSNRAIIEHDFVACIDAALQRAIQACDAEGDQCGDEGNKQAARRCAFRIRALKSDTGAQP